MSFRQSLLKKCDRVLEGARRFRLHSSKQVPDVKHAGPELEGNPDPILTEVRCKTNCIAEHDLVFSNLDQNW